MSSSALTYFFEIRSGSENFTKKKNLSPGPTENSKTLKKSGPAVSFFSKALPGPISVLAGIFNGRFLI